MEQIVDISISGGGLQGFRPRQLRTFQLVFMKDLDDSGEGGFRTFHRVTKSAKLGSAPRVGRLSADFTSSTRQLMWIPGSVATTSGSASTPCTGHNWRKLLSDHWQWYPPWERR